MFDPAYEPEPHPMVARVLDPGRAVWVDLRVLLRDATGRTSSGLTLIVRAQGIALDQTVPGELHAWLRTNTGGWLGLTSFVVQSKALGTLRLRHLVCSQALSLRENAQPSTTD